MKKKIKLSDLDPTLNVDEIIDFLLDLRVYIIVNDIVRKRPLIEYELDELYEVWDLLRTMIVLQN